ncbi:MAG: hypothetical protein SGPRY_004273, partial [Prymnesium sp.]
MEAHTPRLVLALSASVAATCCLVVSNKDLLGHPALHEVGPFMLLFLHRIVTWFFYRMTYCCKPYPRKQFSWFLLIGASALANGSILASFLTLKIASVAFQQLSRLMVIPIGAFFDFMLYGKRRGLVECFSLLLLSYGVYMASSGDATATPLAILYTGVGVVLSIGSSSVTGHIMKTTSVPTADLVMFALPYEIVFAGIVLVITRAYTSAQNDPERPLKHQEEWSGLPLLLRMFVNGSLAIAVVYLTVWSQGKCSNMMYGVLGQAKTIGSIALSAAIFHTELSIRAWIGMSVVVAVSVGLASGDFKQNDEQKSRSKWPFFFLVFLLLLL